MKQSRKTFSFSSVYFPPWLSAFTLTNDQQCEYNSFWQIQNRGANEQISEYVQVHVETGEKKTYGR